MIGDAMVSAVNLAEALTKLVDRGATLDQARAVLSLIDFDVVDFNRLMAEAAGGLVLSTRRHGLSLGDRACLALAMQIGVPAVTADRAWKHLDLGIDVQLIR
jgi:PIN domain nuclease of toxin-antitoxin system